MSLLHGGLAGSLGGCLMMPIGGPPPTSRWAARIIGLLTSAQLHMREVGRVGFLGGEGCGTYGGGEAGREAVRKVNHSSGSSPGRFFWQYSVSRSKWQACNDTQWAERGPTLGKTRSPQPAAPVTRTGHQRSTGHQRGTGHCRAQATRTAPVVPQLTRQLPDQLTPVDSTQARSVGTGEGNRGELGKPNSTTNH